MALFMKDAQFPPEDSLERLAKYERGRKIFEGKQAEIYERATDILKDTPHAEQLKKLYIAVNLADILITKPADLLVGEAPQYESGLKDTSMEQRAINRIVEENDLTKIIHEMAIGAGYRGDTWVKAYYNVRQDFSEVEALGLEVPDVDAEPIIEAVKAKYVFPELSRGSDKRFKAINIARVEWVETRNDEIPFLNVERHIPGYIIYERYKLFPKDVDTTYGVPMQIFAIGEQVPTGREFDLEMTGITHIPVHHIPYKTTDEDWAGISGLEKMETLLTAINDRLVQIDYILWKHSDPIMYGPPVDDKEVRIGGGRYVEVGKEDVAPGYMTWSAQLDAAFKELDMLIGLVFQQSETPQWLFGTTTAEDKGGSGTSHTDGAAIKARFMPILSKVKRIRTHFDRGIRDALWSAQLLEIYANEGVTNFESYAPVYPTINWKDGIPANEKELAEIMQIRTGNKPTIDVQSAIKKQDEVDDEKAAEIISRIEDDEEKANGFVDASIFNAGTEAVSTNEDNTGAEL